MERLLRAVAWQSEHTQDLKTKPADNTVFKGRRSSLVTSTKVHKAILGRDKITVASKEKATLDSTRPVIDVGE